MAALRPIHVVFVHGLLSSARVWRQFRKLIASDKDLVGLVTDHYFEYDSPLVHLRPDRRVPDLDDIADRLRTFLMSELRDGGSVVLVTHSQGGLVAQRFLARMLADHQGRSLERITRIVMFACPNTGSEFALSLRRAAFFWRNAQERDLRPLDDEVRQTQQTILRSIVNAAEATETECYIPIIAYGGMSDKIVPPIATRVFPAHETLAGDHFSVVRPRTRAAPSYLALKRELLASAESDRSAGLRPAQDAPPTPEAEPAQTFVERQAGVSVTPPFGRRDVRLQGRDDLVASIMSSSQASKVHVLAGLGGSGKSRLALEIAHLAQHEGRQVWWVDEVRLTSCMREVANQLGAPTDPVERAWRGSGSATDLAWRLMDANPRKWLLVFDNVDDPERLAPVGGRVSDGTGWLREPRGDGMVVVTSRNRDKSTWGSWAAVHPVPPLDADDGASMLMQLVSDAGGTFEQARLLSRTLGGLPLALRCAADYLNSVITNRIWSGKARIVDYAGYSAAVRQRFASPLGGNSAVLNESLGLEVMRGVFALSLELLANRGLRNATQLLKLFACLNIAPIPYHILLDDEVLEHSTLLLGFTAQRRAVLDGLDSLGLIELAVLDGIEDPDLSHVLSLHPVVQGILRGDEDAKQTGSEYYGLNVRLLLAAIRGVDPDLPESWALWYLIAPHAVEVARAVLLGASRRPDRRVVASALELARLTSRYLIAAGLLAPARDLVPAIIANCQAFGFQPDDPQVLGLRHETGRIALERGDTQAAESELRHVVDARTVALGANNPDTLASGHKLAKAILEQGRFDEAESLLRPIVEAEQHVRGPEHSDTMVVTHSLARAVLAQDRAAEAEGMCREILQIRNRHWSPAHPETLFVRQTLARCLLKQGKTAVAEREVREALREAADHPDVPVALSLRHTLATVLLMQERTGQAVAELETLLADRRRVLGAGHPETERTMRILARARAATPVRPGQSATTVSAYVPRQSAPADESSEP